MLFIYRLVRFLPASTNIQIIVGTVIDEIRNGGAFFGVLFVRFILLHSDNKRIFYFRVFIMHIQFLVWNYLKVLLIIFI